MRKTSVIPAAVLAAGFAFYAGPEAQAAPSTAKKTASVAKHPQAGKPKSELHAAARHKPSKKAKRVIRQTDSGEVVIEKVAVRVPETFGPFLPLEQYDYPQPPCGEVDVVLEALAQGADPTGIDVTEDEEDLAEGVTAPPPNALTRVARTLGSLLRPKSSESTLRPEDVDLSDLLTAGVQIPVEGVDASRLKDSFLNSRGRHRQHLAIDIGAPKGTPVLAAADGEIVQLRREKRGGISLYQKDATGRYLLFYCHLTRYAQGLKAGRKVAKGDVIAYVGRTGHVIGGPHLHFSITRLPEDDDNFKAGVAVNPYLLFLAAVP